MDYKKSFNFLKNLPIKLNNFYKKNSKTNFKVKNKSKNLKDFDPVTNLDRGFEKYIRLMIHNSFPNDSVIGEEYDDKFSSNNFQWCVDPIDGTRAFIIGAPTWSNLVGLSYNNRSVIGLANFPELNKHYISDQKYSYVIKNKKKLLLSSSKNNNLKTIKIIGNFHGTLSYEKQKKIIKKFGWSFRLAGFDALNYCLLAEGKVDTVIEANLKPYDILPLIPIIKNSGAIVTNWKNEPAEKGGNILATSNKKLHKKILKILRPFTKQ
jgi:myo-inositol-1(or 4)-monophosphatase|tara:strand:- start:2219 stop:3013 length:795 start_codon:yes stop_codon:yes gene_type:complete